MQKFSSFGRKKKQTKIRHRMVMLEGLQFVRPWVHKGTRSWKDNGAQPPDPNS